MVFLLKPLRICDSNGCKKLANTIFDLPTVPHHYGVKREHGADFGQS